MVGFCTAALIFSENRDLPAAKRLRRKALKRHGRPDRIARCSLPPIRIRKSKYLNNRIEQDHRRIKRRVRSMLGFKSMASADPILSGIEMVT